MPQNNNVQPGDIITADLINGMLARIAALEQAVAALQSQPPPPTPTFTFPTIITPTFPTFTFPTVITQPSVPPVFTQPPIATIITQPSVPPVFTQPPIATVITQPSVPPVFTQPPIATVINQPSVPPIFNRPPNAPIINQPIEGPVPLSSFIVQTGPQPTDLAMMVVAMPTDQPVASPEGSSAASENDPVTLVRGIGNVRRDALAAVNIDTLGLLADATVDDVAAAANVSEELAADLIAEAQNLLGRS